MNTKNFLISSIAGSVVYFLLGWVFYGKLFTDLYPPSENENLVFVYLGCLSFALLLGYVFAQGTGVSNLMAGLYAGGFVGLLYGMSMNFFMFSSQTPNVTNMITDIALNAVMGGITGAVMAFTASKIK